MRKYEKYKDSGIAWIGEMPEHWNVFPIKHLCRYEKYSVKTGPFGTQLKGDDLQESGDVIVYNQKNVIYQRFDEVRFYVSNQKANELKSFYTQPNDFLITSRGTIGRAAILPNTADMGILHPCLIALRLNRSKVLDKWLLYFINDTDCFRTGIQLASNATTIEVIYTETLKNSLVAIPSIPEQEQIAKYLDWKCGEVDRIVEVRERQLKLLAELRTSVISRAVTRGLSPNAPLKDSGINWIGQIPEHWEICRLKNACSLKGRIGWKGLRSEEFEQMSYAYLVTGQDFHSAIIDWTKCYQISKERYDEDPYIQLSNGDLLITKDGTIGKIAKVSNMDKPSCLNSGIFVMKQTKALFEQSYLYWLLESSLLKEFNNYTSTGTTILHLYQNVFENMPLIIPNLSEQQQIADYLDKKTAEIDSTITKCKVQIDKLKEYRQALITEVVTGKIDVRGIEIPIPKSN